MVAPVLGGIASLLGRLTPYILGGLGGLFVGTEIGVQTAPPSETQIVYGGTGTQSLDRREKQEEMGLFDEKTMQLIILLGFMYFLLKKRG